MSHKSLYEIMTDAAALLEQGAFGYQTADDIRDFLQRHPDIESEAAVLKNKVQKYEDFLHAINYAVTAGNNERIRKLVDNAFKWGYSHRAGNGEYTDEEQDAMVARAMEKLTEE